MFDFTVTTGTLPFVLTCPVGYQLLSCGTENSQRNINEDRRYFKPIDSRTCECYDYFGVNCVAWCTTLPLNGYEIKTVTKSGVFPSDCSTGIII